MHTIGRLVARGWVVGLISLALVLVGISYSRQSTASEISWQTYSANVFTKASQQKKRIFLYGFATWCHYCQHMQASTLSNAAVIKKIQANYIPVKLDIDKDSNAADHYQINSFPTIIIMDSDTNVIARFAGYMEAGELLAKLDGLPQ